MQPVRGRPLVPQAAGRRRGRRSRAHRRQEAGDDEEADVGGVLREAQRQERQALRVPRALSRERDRDAPQVRRGVRLGDPLGQQGGDHLQGCAPRAGAQPQGHARAAAGRRRRRASVRHQDREADAEGRQVGSDKRQGQGRQAGRQGRQTAKEPAKEPVEGAGDGHAKDSHAKDSHAKESARNRTQGSPRTRKDAKSVPGQGGRPPSPRAARAHAEKIVPAAKASKRSSKPPRPMRAAAPAHGRSSSGKAPAKAAKRHKK